MPTITCFHASEVAFWPTPDLHVEDHASNDRLESTANGYGKWSEKETGRSKFVPWFSSVSKASKVKNRKTTK